MSHDLPNCRYCDSRSVKRNGRNASGTRKYLCSDCGRQFVKVPEVMHPPYPQHVKRSAVARVQNGESPDVVAFEIGCDMRTLRTWVGEAGLLCSCGRNFFHVGVCRQRYQGIAA